MAIQAGDGPSPSPYASSGEEAGVSNFYNAAPGSGSGGGKVYMGPKAPIHIEGKGFYQPKGNLVIPLNEAYGVYNNFSGKQLRDFINKGIVAGQLQEDAGFIEGQALWKKLVDASASLTSAGRQVTPSDVLDSYLGGGPLGAAGKQGGDSAWQVQYRGGRKFLVNSQTGEVKYQGPKFETTYAKSIDLTDPTTAKAIAQSVFQQLMHRDPGKGEMGQFASALTAAEQNSPQVTNTTVEYDPNTGEAIGQSSVSTGGFGADAKQYLAQQQAKKSKDYGAIQASTTYANALESAVFNNPYGSI